MTQTRSALNRPNLVYIHSHDTGRYIQPYGHSIATPNLQKLAEDGVLFRQAFCAAPTCSPSRAALLTGQCAHSSGMLGLAHDIPTGRWRLRDYKQHIIHTLKAAGYVSVLCGLQHVVDASHVGDIGYDLVLGQGGAEEHAVAFLEDRLLHRGEKKEENLPPFFLDVGFFETHRNGGVTSTVDNGAFNKPKRLGDGRYAAAPAPLPDAPPVRADIADFAVCAARLDEKIGRVFDALKRCGEWDNTLVISTTDHGIPFPNMKCSLFDHGMGVSLILRGPGGFTGGRAVDALVSHIDVFPTVCDLLEIKKPAWLQGVSLLPLARGEKSDVRDAVFAEVTYHAAYEPKRAVRTRRAKYIRYFDGLQDTERRFVPNNCDASPSKDYWRDAGWADILIAGEQLYDLRFDPNETRNLAADPAWKKTREEMRARLDKWMRDTDDPLLRGPVAPMPMPPPPLKGETKEKTA